MKKTTSRITFLLLAVCMVLTMIIFSTEKVNASDRYTSSLEEGLIVGEKDEIYLYDMKKEEYLDIVSVSSGDTSVFTVTTKTDTSGNKAFYATGKAFGVANYTITFKNGSGAKSKYTDEIVVIPYPKWKKTFSVNGKNVDISKNKFSYTQYVTGSSQKIKLITTGGNNVDYIDAYAFKDDGSYWGVKITDAMLKNGKAFKFPDNYDRVEIRLGILTEKEFVNGDEYYDWEGYVDYEITLVQRKSISKANVTLSKTSYAYNGKVRKPSVKVKLGKKTLKEGTDYKVTYSNNINASKKAVVKVTGIGKYKGSVSKKFTIKPVSLNKNNSKVSLPYKECEYNGKYRKPAVTVKFYGKKLTKGTDFTVKYSNNKEIGTAKVTVKGKGNFKGSKAFSFEITKAKQPIKLSTGSLCVRYRDLGSSVDVTVSGIKEKAKIKATSDNTKIATVKKIGDKYRITFRDAGTARITFSTTKETEHYKKTSKTIEVTVVDDRKVPKLFCARDKKTEIPRDRFIMNPKEMKAFSLNAITNSDGQIMYEIVSGNKDIITINNTGKVKLTGKEGAVKLKVSVEGTMTYKPESIVIEIVSSKKDLYWPVRVIEKKDDLDDLIAKSTINKHPGDIVLDNPHRGVDVVYEKGEKWYSASDGEIFLVLKGCKHNGNEDHKDCKPNHPELNLTKNRFGVVCNSGFGNGVVIKSVINDKTYYFQYAHMDSVSNDIKNLKKGDKVYKGTYLGTVGNKGNSFGEHAHFEIDLETNHDSKSVWQYWGEPVNNDPTDKNNCIFTYYYNETE